MNFSKLILLNLAFVSLTSVAQTTGPKQQKKNLLSEIKHGSIYQSISSELHCAEKIKVNKTSDSLNFEILDSELSYRVAGRCGVVGYAPKISFVFNDINKGKKLIRGTDSDMRAVGITGKVTSETKADHDVITNKTVQNDKNTFFSMLIDHVPRRLYKTVEKMEMRKDQNVLNFKVNIKDSDFGIREQDCSYQLID